MHSQARRWRLATRRWRPGLPQAVAVVALLLGTACGAAPAAVSASGDPGNLTISPQNDDLVVGGNRLSLVLQRGPAAAVLGAVASVDVVAGGAVQQTRRLTFVGADYPGLPIYVAPVRFPRSGDYLLVVRAILPGGGREHGLAHIRVNSGSSELGVGQPMPRISQPLAGPSPVADVDSGVPADPWHDITVADALAGHRPMLVYVGEPGRCLTSACGDTIAVLHRLCTTYCARLTFIHIEVHYPARAESLNVGYVPFHLAQEQPFVYFVTAGGTVSDRFEGPAPLDDYAAAAEGTLAGRVPAVAATG